MFSPHQPSPRLAAGAYAPVYALRLRASDLDVRRRSRASLADAEAREAATSGRASQDPQVRQGLKAASDLGCCASAAPEQGLLFTLIVALEPAKAKGSDLGFCCVLDVAWLALGTRAKAIERVCRECGQCVYPRFVFAGTVPSRARVSVDGHVATRRLADPAAGTVVELYVISHDGTVSIEQAARMCGVSDETIRRRLRSDRLAGATRVGAAGVWRIPVTALVDDGLAPDLSTDGDERRSAVREMEAQVAAVQAVADERLARIEQLERHVADLRAVIEVFGGRS